MVDFSSLINKIQKKLPTPLFITPLSGDPIVSSLCGLSCTFPNGVPEDTKAIVRALMTAGLSDIRGSVTPELASAAVQLIEAGVYGTPGDPPDILQTGTSGIRTTKILNTVQSQSASIVAIRANHFLTSATTRDSDAADRRIRRLADDLDVLAPELPTASGETSCILVSPKKLKEESNVQDTSPDGIFRFLTGADNNIARFPSVRRTTPSRVLLQLIYEFAGNFDRLFGESSWLSLPDRLPSHGYAVLGKPAKGKGLPFLCFSEKLPSGTTGSLIFSS